MNTHKHRISTFIARLLVLSMLFSMLQGFAFPVAATVSGSFNVLGGTEDVDYSFSGNVLTIMSSQALVIYVTSPDYDGVIKVASGVCANFTLSASLKASCPLDLSQAGDCTITCREGYQILLHAEDDHPAIHLPKNNLVTFKGAGTIEAYGGASYPGIGRQGGGNVVFDGPTVLAVGGSSGAGIGSAWGYDSGSITIKSGTVTARGGEFAAGIGSANQSAVGTIKIEGGFVSATGGKYGPGIGGGSGSVGCGNITISGGTVIAKGGEGGPGIGTGRAFDISTDNGSVTITGGYVTATGPDCEGDPAGIGGGAFRQAGKITISGGTVIANGSQKGIGSGAGAVGGSILINGGSVTANGIGTGGYNSSVTTNIKGGAVVCTDSSFGGINKGNQSSWSGIVIEGTSGRVYGSTTLSKDFVNSYNLTIPGGCSLTIPKGLMFSNSGTVSNSGTIINNGSFVDVGTFSGNAVSGNAPIQEISYLDCDANGQNWTTATKTKGTITSVSSENTSWGSAGKTTWYLLTSNPTVGNPIIVSGDVRLILANNCTLTAERGIAVPLGNSLTVYAQSTDIDTMGKIFAYPNIVDGNYSTGIGSLRDADCGTLTFNGGNISTFGCFYHPAIGGGPNKNGGNITINGGIVSADNNGGTGGVAIGNAQSGHDAVINFNGGILKVKGLIRMSNSRDNWKGILLTDVANGIEAEPCGNITLDKKNADFLQGKRFFIRQAKSTLTIPSGMSLSTESTNISNAEGTLINNGTYSTKDYVGNSGTITNNGNFIFNGSTFTNNSTLTLNKNSTATFNGNFSNKGKLVNYGDCIIQGTINNEGGYTIDNSGTFTVNGTANNHATLTNSGTFTVNGWHCNNKTLTNSGAFTVHGAGVNNGTLMNNGSTFTVDGAYENNGEITNNAKFIMNDAFNNRDKSKFHNNGTCEVTGTLTNFGTIDSSGMLTCKGLFDNTNGQMSGNYTAGDKNNVPSDSELYPYGSVSGENVHNYIDYTYKDNVLTIFTSKPITVRMANSGATTADRIVVKKGVNANLTLENVSIDTEGGNAILLDSEATLNLTLKGSNKLQPASRNAGICVPDGTTVNIGGDGSLDVAGGRGGNNGGAGIGANRNGSIGTINITGGVIYAHAQPEGGGAGIGNGGWGGSGGTVNITGGRITSSGSGNELSFAVQNPIKIQGAEVFTFDNKLNDATIDNCLVAINGTCNIYGTGYTLSKSLTIPDNITLVVEEGKTLTIATGVTLTIPQGTGAILIKKGNIVNNGTIDGTITDGAALMVDRFFLSSTGTEVITEGTDYTLENGVLTILTPKKINFSMANGGKSSACITIASNVTANLTFDSVSIETTSSNAVLLGSGATLNLTLKGTNKLQPSRDKAGICVPGGTTINIDGNGYLDAAGGLPDSGCGAGIGSNANETIGTINIKGGTIYAHGSYNGGAGVGDGGGGGCSGGEINITGGYITASGGGNERSFCVKGDINVSGAVIFTRDDMLNKAVSITDSLVTMNSVCKMYGESFTLSQSLTIPEDITLIVGEGQTLTIPQGVTLSNNGTLVKDGEIINNGTFNEGIVCYTIKYMDASVDAGGKVTMTEKSEQAFAITEESVTLGAADDEVHWYVVKENVTITDRIMAIGDVRLILSDNCTLTALGGINVNTDNSLTIYGQSGGTGKLDAGENTTLNRSGIGGGDGNGGGNITINGGVITAKGGQYGAGIGGGNMRNDFGTTTAVITINGGNVTSSVKPNPTATPSYYEDAAGIGGGYHGSSGIITINGGTVTAIGGRRGAGIGAGRNGGVDTITINGGDITAISNGASASIGRGNDDDGGAIFINGGTITTQDNSADHSGKAIETIDGAVFTEKSGFINGSKIGGNLTIPKGYTLTIAENQTVTLPKDITLENNGTIVNNGKLVVSGAFLNYGTIEGNNAIGRLGEAAFVGGFMLTATDGGETPVLNTDYEFTDHYLTIISAKDMTIHMAQEGATTGDRIGAHWDLTSTLTIQDISIDTTVGNGINVRGNAILNLTLAGNNKLRPGGGQAGICVSGLGTLTIGGDGYLDVGGGRPGGRAGAGIGANEGGSIGTINITGGNIYAHAQEYGGAGIGEGGWGGGGGVLNITGGYVTVANTSGDEGSVKIGSVAISNAVIVVKDNKLDNVAFENSLFVKNDEFTIYGSNITLPYDLTIPEESTLTIPEGAMFTISDGATLTNNGSIINNGTITGGGTIAGSGTLSGSAVNTDFTEASVDGNGMVTLTESNHTATVLKSDMTTLGTSDDVTYWYVVNSNITIPTRISVLGNVHLILMDGYTLTATQGITVDTDDSLTIYGQSKGTGKLVAGTTAWRASIGGAHGTSIGTLVINGGDITADGTSSYYKQPDGTEGSGAAIGNGYAHSSNVGSVIINNGKVTAIGGLNAAGIGGGKNGEGCNVIIRGGTVSASGNSASDIGRGSGSRNGRSFSTGKSGTATIYADVISDTSKTAEWNCLLVSKDKTKYTAYGNLTLTQNLTIPSGSTLTINSGSTLTIPYTLSFTNNGTLKNSGTIRLAFRRLYLTSDDGTLPIGGVDYEYKSPADIKILSSKAMTVYGNGVQGLDCVAVSAGITANLTLNNVYIHVTGRSPFYIPSVTGKTTEVNLTLVGSNTLKAASEGFAGLQTSMNSLLTISGTGSLNAVGNTYGAGIGGGNSSYNGTPENDAANGGNIIINGGTITATAGQYGAGIGDGDYKAIQTPATSASVTITGGTVKTTSIGKGSDHTATTPGVFSTGENGCAAINVGSISNTSGNADWKYFSLSDDGLKYTEVGNVTLVNDMTIPKGSTLIIPSGSVLTVPYTNTLTISGSLDNKGVLRIATRRLYLTSDDGTLPIYGTDYEYISPADLIILSSKAMTVHGSGAQASDSVAVKAGITANLTFDNVYIHLAGRSPFYIPSVTGKTTNVNLTLVGSNTLKAASEGFAGLQTSMNSVLTISGTGSLSTRGNLYGAGIGGGATGNFADEVINAPETGLSHGGKIIIAGGIINATPGEYAAGIGDGDYYGVHTPATSSSVTITGGVVTTTSIGKGSDSTATVPGVFSTGENGGAVICTGSISNTSGKADWDYISLTEDGLTYTVIGDVTLKQNLTIPKGSTLEIPTGATLTVAEGYTLTNNGWLKTPNAYLDAVRNEDGNVTKSEKTAIATLIKADTATLGASDGKEYWYIAKGDVTVSDRMVVTGNVHLILADGCTLNVPMGISVDGDNSLTIYAQTAGSGKLNTGTTAWRASIGGGHGGGMGTLVINGGIITADATASLYTSSSGEKGSGAAIGSGYNSAGGGTTGSVTVNDGIVTATSGTGIGKGTSGAAVTFMVYGNSIVTADAVSDKSGQADWGGIVGNGTDYTVYGNVTLSQNLTIPENGSLTVTFGKTLTVPSDVTLTINGKSSGRIVGDGFRTENYRIVSVNGGKVVISAVQAKEVYVFYAVYDDNGGMTGVQCVETALEVKQDNEIVFASVPDGTNYEVFLFEKSSYAPLCEAYKG